MILREHLKCLKVKESNSLGKIASSIESNLMKEEILISYDTIMFVLKRFFHYAIRMILNGWPVSIRVDSRVPASFSLCYDHIRKLNNREKRIYFHSTKMISYMLYVNTQRGMVNTVTFYPGDELQVGMIRIANSDLIYKYIKR